MKKMEEKALLETKKDVIQQKIDDYCNVIDGSDLNI